MISLQEAKNEYADLDGALKTLQSFSWVDQKRLKKAIEYTWHAHQNQKRKSGEPFAVHPLCVAAILGSQKLHEDTIIAGLFHDILEDTEISKAEMSKEWGTEIANLVDGVTKIVKIARRGDAKREKIETYRKLLLAAAQDARVLVIKLADRLHNMRTIEGLKPDRQKAISKETLEIYAPIAHRLGMYQIKAELQDRSFRVLDPESYRLAELIQKDVQKNIGDLGKYEQKVKNSLETEGINSSVKTRVKNCWSISQKLGRKSSEDTLYDILGMRIIVDQQDDCYRALGLVHNLWAPRFDRFHDYIAVPKSNLYQSLHTTVNLPEGEPLEIQIRTKQQDEVAEYGIAAHWHYKERLSEGGPQSTKKWIKDTAKGQNNNSFDEAFENLKADAFANEIYVCSPAGDIYILPEKACPVDFAYAVHSELGDQCVGAKISGIMKPLNSRLHNGDVVEVLTKEGSHPSKDWLSFTKTSKARQHIRHWYSTAEESDKTENGWKLLVQRAKKNRVGYWETQDHLATVLIEIGYDNPDAAAFEVGYNPEKAKEIIRRVIKHLANTEQKTKPVETDSRPHVKVQGMQVPVRFASCCSAQPGDSIVGYISIGRGISVHVRDCPQIKQFNTDRLVEVEWEENARGGKLELQIAAKDRRGLLVEIADTVYDQGGEIINISFYRSGVVTKGTIVCWIPGPWEALIGAMENVEGMLQVQRKEMMKKTLL